MPTSTLGFDFNFSPNQIIFGGLGIILVAFLAISIVLTYHWTKYGIHKNTVRAVMIIYFAVSLILIYSMVKAALTINSTL